MAIIYISFVPIIKIAVKYNGKFPVMVKTNPEYFESISESLFCWVIPRISVIPQYESNLTPLSVVRSFS